MPPYSDTEIIPDSEGDMYQHNHGPDEERICRSPSDPWADFPENQMGLRDYCLNYLGMPLNG
jgi:hypothetical protein